MLHGKRILLVIGGGIAAYKCLELIRRLRERGADVRCVMTASAKQFVTPLSVSALSGDRVYDDQFSLTDEHEMGHIQLSRSADLVVVAPATANLLARMAQGIADELATTVLLATDKDVMAAPAMNVRMWEHPATRANAETLRARGVRLVGPDDGDMACGEYGPGRMAEPDAIAAAIEAYFGAHAPLSGRRALVTSGPTHEAVDPVRYIANRSSGKQGHAIAAAIARLGARTTLVTGPTHEPDPAGVTVVRIESAREMLAACRAALPADIAVCAAAVSDWRPAAADAKIKKNGAPPSLALTENPDILKTLSEAGNARPRLVIGFAAETGDVVAKAGPKRAAKGCDWIVANDVSPGTGTFGGDDNTVHLLTAEGIEDWPRLTKAQVADRLAARIAAALGPAE
ncbi:MAG: bifunctional phosphopantothenoylcysteine decarboxylase/phosphopantothenate--cysteine ligase CoaBC [Alphaproteobacteria bacterium]|nr:bifunctional phosphopantothenoylcysteine decarboxylase/phosphopantothenate--cysteine ligase CoaBC [Alphaproteobacteria bacterium]